MGGNLLNYFYANEFLHVDEIHRIGEGVLYGGLGGGWFYLPGESGSGDWDMARLVGGVGEALEFLGAVPKENTVFMVPNGLEFGGPLKRKAMLGYYLSTEEKEVIPSESFLSLKEGYKLEFKREHMFLLHSEVVVGYVKPVRKSKNAYEVYIEIMAGYRGRGLGLPLLESAVFNYAKLDKKVVYVVDLENSPSRKLVERAGFEKIGLINTYNFT